MFNDVVLLLSLENPYIPLCHKVVKFGNKFNLTFIKNSKFI